MTEDQIERPLDRRLLLRGGAVMAGAAGVAVISSLAPTKAEAAPVEYVKTGQDNASSATTGLTIGTTVGDKLAALALTNKSGPALLLEPVGDGYTGDLKLGEIASTEEGPEIGVDVGIGVQTTWLATGLDLDQIPFTIPVGPERLLDTRTEQGRESIRTTSTDAFDSAHHLKAGAWLDVGVIPASIVGLEAVFVNVTVVGPTTNGYVTVYPPGDRPVSSTVNFVKAQVIANGAFIATDIADEDKEWVVVRIFSTATTHLVVDLTGVTVYGVAGNLSNNAGRASKRTNVTASRVKRILGK